MTVEGRDDSMARRVLVVDDESHIIQVLAYKLRAAGYEVLTAADGEEALEICEQALPDLVVTDYQMPVMSGIELCRALRRDPRSEGIPVVMLTARGYGLDGDALRAEGVSAIVSKPFSPRALLERIEALLGEDSARDAAA